MAMNFKKISQAKGLIENDLLVGRVALPLREVLGEELTLTHVVRSHWNKDGEEGDRAVMLFKEYPDNYIPASGDNVPRNIFAWAESANCPRDDSVDVPFANFDALNAEFASIGGLHIMVVRAKTSKGHDRNQLVILD